MPDFLFLRLKFYDYDMSLYDGMVNNNNNDDDDDKIPRDRKKLNEPP